MFITGLFVANKQWWFVVYDGRPETPSYATRYAFVPIEPVAAPMWYRDGVWRSFEALRTDKPLETMAVSQIGPTQAEFQPLVAGDSIWLTPNAPTRLRFPIVDLATTGETVLSAIFDSSRYILGLSRADQPAPLARTFPFSALF